MKFKDLGLNQVILKSIEESGYETPSLIQEQAIPYILQGKDILGCAQTGTGKTAAFALPLINNLIKSDNIDKTIKVLVLTPTRELAIQVRDNFRKYSVHTNLKCSVIFGGVNQQSQIDVLKKGVDILVATPGRLLDLINQKYVKLNNLKTLVLDEADTMLDMGFIHDVKKIITHIPIQRQTLLFSATMPNEITNLATSLLKDYVTVKVNPESLTVERIDQVVYFVDKHNKAKLLLDILQKDDIKSVLVFTRTKHGANKLGELLTKSGINIGVIHGNKSQSARVSALENFKNGNHKILVATDIAARGIDIRELSHVINYELPETGETYVHRIGRTGRAGFSGMAISFCNIDEKQNLKDIEKTIKQTITIVDKHNYPLQQFNLTPKGNNKPNFNRNFSNNKNKKSFHKR
jgi:ATP-dependent RNA helicase RhlE